MLTVSGLYHRFGELTALDGVSLEVAPGQIVGLVGRNGAGKTTTMRSIIGVLNPEKGDMTWQGGSLEPEVRLQFGYMPEERGLYPQMSVLKQVRYFARLHGLGPATSTEAARTWIEHLGLGGREQDRLIALSHGNQQRVQLAVALVHNPTLLVLDEPFAGLDPSAVDSLSDIIRAQASDGKAILFSSHQLDLVERLCERVVVLELGKVVAAGDLDDLRSGLPRHLRVKGAATADRLSQIAGVQVVADGPDGSLLQLAPDIDPQDVLRTALDVGPVEHFGYEQAGLVDLYRQLVP